MNTHVPLRSILLATNLSDMDWLFPFSCSLAQESGAQVTVLHVLSTWDGFTADLSGNPYYDPAEAMESATRHLRDCCRRPCAARVDTEVIASDGAPADGILAMANQIHADLIVTGTSSFRGMERWVHGSVAEQVLRSAQVPVVTVGPKARVAAAAGRPIKSILFATSLQSEATEAQNLELILKWTERLHAHLTLLHVVADERKETLAQERLCEAREERLRALLPEDALREGFAHVCVRTGQPSREILSAAARLDLIALGALPTPVLGRFAAEGTLNKVLAEAHCPVATMHTEHSKGTARANAKTMQAVQGTWPAQG